MTELIPTYFDPEIIKMANKETPISELMPHRDKRNKPKLSILRSYRLLKRRICEKICFALCPDYSEDEYE